MIHTFKKWLGIFFLIFSTFLYAESPSSHITVDLQDISTHEALRLLAKFLKINIVISPSIQGKTSLHFHDTPKEEAFDLFLNAHALAKIQIDNTWFIGTAAELNKRQEEENKIKTTWEETAPLQTQIWQIYFAKAEDIAHILHQNGQTLLSQRGKIRVDPRTNMICIQDTPHHLKESHALIKRLDRPVQQILIEARLATVDSDFERELGIHFAVNPAKTQNSTLKTTRYSLAVATLADGSQLDVLLAALENEGHGELISNPSLFTANQQTAAIEAGEEIPYQETSEGGGTAVAFKKAVLSLKVTPQILPNNKVLLELQINQDRPSSRMVLGVPAISTRQITTQVLVQNGKTIVLGGIYESNRENTEQRIPFLGTLPVIGWLFKEKNSRHNKRELLIFVTPKIIEER